MPDPQWENLKDLFHAALAVPLHERAAYLEQACNGDTELRGAVESLLKSHEETDHFLDAPAYQAAAEMLVADNEFKANQTITHYRVVSLLREGGMGKVYLAEDTKLHRQVALKFLASNFTQDQDRLERFAREARAASALNHPNILTIHEIGESDGRRFIATEFIDGETLRERISTGLNTDEALDIAIQIASALVAAHRVGIVHRDIKPENVMIRRDDGLVKVLDFGLAKMSRSSSIERANSVDKHPLGQFKTAPGVVIGTVAYMSPEQARGDAVDARTDIWSLGVILYEMICGTSPFIASTSNEIISGILAKTPTPSIARYALDVPKDLKDVVEKALTKDKQERYQSAHEFVTALRQLKQSPAVTTNNGDVLGAGTKSVSAREHSAAAMVFATTRPASTAEYLVSQLSAHRRGAMAFVAIVLAVLMTGISLYAWRVKHSAAATAVQPEIKSLAVLPLKSLDAGENYPGMGIADSVIRRISQTTQVTVRPTSAVLKYLKDDTDSLTAGRQLKTDAVLEGSVQRVGDRLRVSVNLLRTSDGASLWADNLDMAASDIFLIEDKVAQQVATRLQLHIDSTQQAALNRSYPTSPVAYESYIKGIFSLDQRGYGKEAMPQMQITIDFLKKAIEADPQYALAHAQLGFAYIWTASFIETTEPKWADLARNEIKQAQELGPNLAETHVANAVVLWSAYGGFQTDAAIRESLLARQLNPNYSSPDLAALYGHIGLEDQAARELQRALQVDPTSQSLNDLKTILPYLRGDGDAWFAERRNIGSAFTYVEPWYYLRKGHLDEAQKAIDERLPKVPDDAYDFFMQHALFFALKGNFSEAQARVSATLARAQFNNSASRHHWTYDAACIYALSGNSTEAVKWLKETAATGFPNYPLFARERFLDRIRQTPEFVQFMSEQKAQWDRFQQEFGG